MYNSTEEEQNLKNNLEYRLCTLVKNAAMYRLETLLDLLGIYISTCFVQDDGLSYHAGEVETMPDGFMEWPAWASQTYTAHTKLPGIPSVTVVAGIHEGQDVPRFEQHLYCVDSLSKVTYSWKGDLQNRKFTMEEVRRFA